MEDANLYKYTDVPPEHGGGHQLQHHHYPPHHHQRQCLVRGDGETSLIRNGGRNMEENQRCPLIPNRVGIILNRLHL